MEVKAELALLANRSSAAHVVMCNTHTETRLPQSPSDLRDTVFGTMPTHDTSATKVHFLRDADGRNVTVLVSKLFVIRFTVTETVRVPVKSPASSLQSTPKTPMNLPGGLGELAQQVRAQRAQGAQMQQRVATQTQTQTKERKLPLAVVLFLTVPVEMEASLSMRLASYFLAVDLRLGKACESLQKYVTEMFKQKFANMNSGANSHGPVSIPSASDRALYGSQGSSLVNSHGGSVGSAPRRGSATPQRRKSSVGIYSTASGLPQIPTATATLQTDDFTIDTLSEMKFAFFGLFNSKMRTSPLWQAVLRENSEIYGGLQVLPSPLVTLLGRPGVADGRELATERFLRRLVQLRDLDLPKNNNFVSAAVTAVLAHHKGWVETVCVQKEEHQEEKALFRNKLLHQLHEMFGAPFGAPLMHFVVTGSPDDQQDALLEVLSYFLRSPALEVCHVNMEYMPRPVPKIPTLPRSTSPAIPFGQSPMGMSPARSPAKSPARSPGRSPARSPSSPSSPAISLIQKQEDSEPVDEIESVELDDTELSWIGQNVTWHNGASEGSVSGIQVNFRPDVVIQASMEKHSELINDMIDELHVECELYEECFCSPEDSVCAIVADMESRTCETLTIVREAAQNDDEEEIAMTPNAQSQRNFTSQLFSGVLDTYDGMEASAPKKRNRLERGSLYPASHILLMLETARLLWQMGLPPGVCLSLIEDRLHELLTMSSALVEYLQSTPRMPSRDKLEVDLHFGPGDLRLVASLLQGSRRWPLV